MGRFRSSKISYMVSPRKAFKKKADKNAAKNMPAGPSALQPSLKSAPVEAKRPPTASSLSASHDRARQVKSPIYAQIEDIENRDPVGALKAPSIGKGLAGGHCSEPVYDITGDKSSEPVYDRLSSVVHTRVPNPLYESVDTLQANPQNPRSASKALDDGAATPGAASGSVYKLATLPETEPAAGSPKPMAPPSRIKPALDMNAARRISVQYGIELPAEHAIAKQPAVLPPKQQVALPPRPHYQNVPDVAGRQRQSLYCNQPVKPQRPESLVTTTTCEQDVVRRPRTRPVRPARPISMMQPQPHNNNAANRFTNGLVETPAYMMTTTSVDSLPNTTVPPIGLHSKRKPDQMEDTGCVKLGKRQNSSSGIAELCETKRPPHTYIAAPGAVSTTARAPSGGCSTVYENFEVVSKFARPSKDGDAAVQDEPAVYDSTLCTPAQEDAVVYATSLETCDAADTVYATAPCPEVETDNVYMTCDEATIDKESTEGRVAPDKPAACDTYEQINLGSFARKPAGRADDTSESAAATATPGLEDTLGYKKKVGPEPDTEFTLQYWQAPVMEFDLDALLAPSTATPSCKSPAVVLGKSADHREVVVEAQSPVKQEAASPEMQPPPPKDPFVVSPPPAHWTTANTVPHVGSRCRAQMKGEWYTAVVTAIDDDRLTCLYMHDGSEDILQQGPDIVCRPDTPDNLEDEPSDPSA